jgi:hypothetical protein
VKDPERLLQSGGTPAERILLGAGAAEEPPPGGAARLASLLVPPIGGAPGPSTAPPPAAPGAFGALGAKWAIVAAGAVAFGGAVLAIASRTPPDQGTPPSALGTAAPAPQAPAPAESVVPALGVQSPPVNSPEATPSSAVESPRKRAESGSVGGAPSIAREIRTLDQVRGLLAKGEGRRALAELDRYRAEAPRGTLGQEATLLRIEALVVAGDKPAARRLAQKSASARSTAPRREPGAGALRRRLAARRVRFREHLAGRRPERPDLHARRR